MNSSAETMRQRAVEVQHQRRVQPHPLKSRQPLRERLNHERRAVRPQHAHRVRIERDHRRPLSVAPRPLHHRLQNFLVAQVQPVKISDMTEPRAAIRRIARPIPHANGIR